MAWTINNGKLYFNTKLYTGNGGTNAITGVGFQPDWTWIKGRSVAYSNTVFDVIRGATKRIETNTSGAESTLSTGLTTWGTDGFTLGSSAAVNENSATFASWNWKAGTSFTNDASGTGIGTIDSTGSFNNTAGFSIVSYTGTGSAGTIKHGLNSVPKMIIIKARSAVKDWTVYHNSISAENYLELNQTIASTDSASTFNDTVPTSSVFSVGTNGQTNGSSTTYIAYCFAEKQGYSKFSSYTGNGNADGTYIHLGFKPAWVMFKRTSGGTSNWTMLDTKRSPHNLMINELYANHPNVESQNGRDIDCLSNGIKIRSSSAEINASGGTYIYMAFAENPFVTSTGVPATAR